MMWIMFFDFIELPRGLKEVCKDSTRSMGPAVEKGDI